MIVNMRTCWVGQRQQFPAGVQDIPDELVEELIRAGIAEAIIEGPLESIEEVSREVKAEAPVRKKKE
jgi:SOS response regulatory protein OraA/RecX